MTRWVMASTGVSSLPFNNNYLETLACLREAGAGGSNPLTPTSSILVVTCVSIAHSMSTADSEGGNSKAVERPGTCARLLSPIDTCRRIELLPNRQSGGGS